MKKYIAQFSDEEKTAANLLTQLDGRASGYNCAIVNAARRICDHEARYTWRYVSSGVGGTVWRCDETGERIVIRFVEGEGL